MVALDVCIRGLAVREILDNGLNLDVDLVDETVGVIEGVVPCETVLVVEDVSPRFFVINYEVSFSSVAIVDVMKG